MTPVDVKACPRCKQVKLRSDFHRCSTKSDGLASLCKVCRNAQNVKSRRDKYDASREPIQHGQKSCSRCKEIKPVQEFHVSRREEDGRSPACRACRAQINNIWRQADEALSKEREQTKRWRANNHDRYLELARAHQEKLRINLGSSYIAKALGMRPSDVTPDLLKMKQEQLSIYRLARKLKKAKHESSKDPC